MSAPETESMTRVEAISEPRFSEANRINNEFLGKTGKQGCGCCSYGWCPETDSEFSSEYRKHPEKMGLTAVAVGKNDKVIGVLKLSVHGVKRSLFETLMHTMEPGEAYIEWVAVTARSRGQGAGSLLMQWAETTARSRGATRITLGVVNGNPAQKLYERIGYVPIQENSFDQCCSDFAVFCLLGRPQGKYGAIMMEKRLD